MSDAISLPGHPAWLQAECERLLAFGHRSPIAGRGAAYLDADGDPDHTRPPATWITARMVHVYGLGHLMGLPGCRELAERALSGLTGDLRDDLYGGWFHDASRPDTKQAYDHAFVVLAAATATTAGLAGGPQLLADALDVVTSHFWRDDDALLVDATDRSFTHVDPYRGLNANMHAVEAFLAASDATGDAEWLRRAARIATFAVSQAASNRWRLPEHYNQAWQPLMEYNADLPLDPFRPYGATIGHGFEWARLLLHLEASGAPGEWLEPARRLYDRAASDGWAPDGNDGFIYTTGWDGAVVGDDRLHWVAAEAVSAAAALGQRTGESRYEADYTAWWNHVAERFVDRRRGSWHHQLDARGRVDGTVWAGKPDLYHAVQATLIPRLPLTPSMACAVAQGSLI